MSKFNASNVHMQFVGTETLVEDHVLQSACDSARLDPRWRREPVRASRIFTRTANKIELPEHHEVRQVNMGKEEIVFEVIAVHGGEGERENTYTHKCSIVFDRLSNYITVPYCGAFSADGHAIERQCRDLYAQLTSHNATDIRELALKFLRTQGIKVMPGMYYVPPSASNDRDLAALKDVFSQLSVAYPDQEAVFPDLTNVVVWARKSLETEIESITKALESIDPEKARDSTLGNKMDEFNTLRGKIELIATTLQFKADDLQDRITDVASRFRKRMLGEFDLPDAHKPVAVTEKAAPVIPITSARAEEPMPNVDDIMSLIGNVDDEVGF